MTYINELKLIPELKSVKDEYLVREFKRLVKYYRKRTRELGFMPSIMSMAFRRFVDVYGKITYLK